MRWGRLALGAGLAAPLAALALSCSHVIGADEPVRDVVVDMCGCTSQLQFLGEACDAYLRRQLDGVTDDKRAAWLANYVAKCGDCASVLECFYTAPTCTTLGCTRPEECCSFPDGGGCDDAGQCR